MASLPSGVWVQTYRAKWPGASHDARIAGADAWLGRLAGLGVAGVAFHGFATELGRREFLELEALAQAHGLASAPAFGVDAADPAGKGARLAVVANAAASKTLVLDAEGAYDPGKHAEAHALAVAFRRDAPDALVVDQSWPVPTLHAGFPYAEFAGFADIAGHYVPFVNAHAEQRYYNEPGWVARYGIRRVAVLEPWFDASEAALDARLPPEARRAHLRTLQGAGWSDVPWACVQQLVLRETFLLWCEPWPSDAALHALEARRRLDARVGLYLPGGAWGGATAVARFQRAYNEDAAAMNRLEVDGVYGPATDRALFGGSVARAARRLGRALGLGR